MSEPIMAHKIAQNTPTVDPIESLRDAIAYSSNDWGAARDFAWIYGIVLGWEDEDDLATGSGALREVADRFGWSPEKVGHLRRLHAEFDRIAAEVRDA